MKKILTLTLAAVIMVLSFDSASAAKKMTVAKMEKAIKVAMDTCLTRGLSVVFFRGNDIVYQKAFGYRDFESKTPLQIDDKFRIASISKSFSAASIMQLREAGKVELTDDINGIMGMNIRNPRYPDDPITMHMLLSHTSSMYDGPGGAAKYRDLTYIDDTKQPKEELMKRYGKYAPGKGWKYCNRAYNMMGCVIERLSGERFDNYVRQHILLPMGIEDAGYNIDTLDRSNLVSLYIYDTKDNSMTKSKTAYERKAGGEKAVEKGTYILGTNGWGWSPTGGMKISAPNLAKWAMTLRNGGIAPNGVRIVPEEGVKLMTTPKSKTDIEGMQYGYAIRISDLLFPGKRMVGHTGSAQGLKSAMFFEETEGWGFVVIASSTIPERKDGVSLINYKVAQLLYECFVN